MGSVSRTETSCRVSSPVSPTELRSKIHRNSRQLDRTNDQNGNKESPLRHSGQRPDLAVVPAVIKQSPGIFAGNRRPSKIISGTNADSRTEKIVYDRNQSGPSNDGIRARIPSSSSFHSGIYDNVHNDGTGKYFVIGATGMTDADSVKQSPTKSRLSSRFGESALEKPPRHLKSVPGSTKNGGNGNKHLNHYQGGLLDARATIVYGNDSEKCEEETSSALDDAVMSSFPATAPFKDSRSSCQNRISKELFNKTTKSDLLPAPRALHQHSGSRKTVLPNSLALQHQFSCVSIDAGGDLPDRNRKIRSKSAGRHLSHEHHESEDTDDDVVVNGHCFSPVRKYVDSISFKKPYDAVDYVSKSPLSHDAAHRHSLLRSPRGKSSHGSVVPHQLSQSVSVNSFPDLHNGNSRITQLSHQRSVDAAQNVVSSNLHNEFIAARIDAQKLHVSTRQLYTENLTQVDATTTGMKQTQKDLHRKRLYRVGLNIFNTDADLGLKFLNENGFVGLSPRQVARFLHVRKGLSKNVIGEFLSRNPKDEKHNGAFAHQVLKYFLPEVSFADDVDADHALRRFISLVNLSGEAQRIDRLIDALAAHLYNASAQIRNVFSSELSLQCFCFAIIMLNTDLHHPHFAARGLVNARAMKFDEFVTNLKQALPNNDTLDIAYLRRAYENIRREKLEMGEDHVSQVRQLASRIVAGTSSNDAVITNLAANGRRLVCFCRLYCQSLVSSAYPAVCEQRAENDSARKRISYFFASVLSSTRRAQRRKRSKSASSVFGRNKIRSTSPAGDLKVDNIVPPATTSKTKTSRLIVEQLARAQREVFLFNDLLLITQQKQQRSQRRQSESTIITTVKSAKQSGQQAPTLDTGIDKPATAMDETFCQWYELKVCIDLHSLRSVELFESHSEPFGVRLISHATGEPVLIFGARNASDRDNFSADLIESIAEAALTSQMLEQCERNAKAARSLLAESATEASKSGDSTKVAVSKPTINSESSSSSISQRNSAETAYSTASSSLSALSSLSVSSSSAMAAVKSPIKHQSNKPTNSNSSFLAEPDTNFTTAVVGITPTKKPKTSTNFSSSRTCRLGDDAGFTSATLLQKQSLRMSSSASSTTSPVSMSFNNSGSSSEPSAVDQRL